MLKRYTPLKRSPLKRSTTRLARQSTKRAKETNSYRRIAAAYLNAHPICQIWIARMGFKESEVLQDYCDFGCTFYRGLLAPKATQIHHRNKRNGVRLCDTRWFMSACDHEHDQVENRKAWAREQGFLLDISADPDGMTPAGVRGLETPDLMRLKEK